MSGEGTRLLFVGGNGHCAWRLDGVRHVLRGREDRPFELVDVPLPGFEGRTAPDDLGGLLAALADAEREALSSPERVVWYGSGIGALMLIAARARGLVEPGVPLLAQGAVLWGLATRRFPVLMRRIPGARAGLEYLLSRSFVQRRFVRKHFLRPLEPEEVRSFFAGYAECPAFGRLFEWFTPALLSELETLLAERPQALELVHFLWGGRDSVVGLEELHATESALDRRLSYRVIPGWGHYPMIDDPRSWVEEVDAELRGA